MSTAAQVMSINFSIKCGSAGDCWVKMSAVNLTIQRSVRTEFERTLCGWMGGNEAGRMWARPDLHLTAAPCFMRSVHIKLSISANSEV